MFHTIVDIQDGNYHSNYHDSRFQIFPKSCSDITIVSGQYGTYPSTCPKCHEPIIVLNRRKTYVRTIKTVKKSNGTLL